MTSTFQHPTCNYGPLSSVLTIGASAEDEVRLESLLVEPRIIDVHWVPAEVDVTTTAQSAILKVTVQVPQPSQPGVAAIPPVPVPVQARRDPLRSAACVQVGLDSEEVVSGAVTMSPGQTHTFDLIVSGITLTAACPVEGNLVYTTTYSLDLGSHFLGCGGADPPWALPPNADALRVFRSAPPPPPPTELRLYLDVDNNFSVSNPTSDINVYLPGGNINRASVSLPQTVKVIAAFVNLDTQAIVAPPSGTTQASFALQVTSAFRGYAMNAGTAQTPDFSLSATTASFSSDNTARVNLLCHDYGGFTTVQVSAGSQTVQMRVPNDEDGNLLPDGGWLDADQNLVVPGNKAADADDDDAPWTSNGINGDNLSAYQEYRGFMVLGQHRRTSLTNKDLFIVSDVFPNHIQDASNLPFPKHRLYDSEKDSDRRINFNRTNYGSGNSIPGTDQRCLVVYRDDINFCTGCYGQGSPSQPRPWIPNGIERIDIYVRNIRWASPPTNNPDITEPLDDEGIKHIQGHEVGHGVNMIDREYLVNPPPPLSVMIINYITPGGNVQAWGQRWANMPHNYHLNLDVKPNLRLK